MANTGTPRFLAPSAGTGTPQLFAGVTKPSTFDEHPGNFDEAQGTFDEATDS